MPTKALNITKREASKMEEVEVDPTVPLEAEPETAAELDGEADVKAAELAAEV